MPQELSRIEWCERDPEVRNIPSQNVPARPRQASSILVDTGFMFFLKLSAELEADVRLTTDG